MISGVVMTMLFTIMIVHVYRGNKNSWLTTVSVMLVFSGIGALLLGISLYSIYVIELINNVVVLTLAIGVGLFYSLFMIAHFLLATKYRKM